MSRASAFLVFAIVVFLLSLIAVSSTDIAWAGSGNSSSQGEGLDDAADQGDPDELDCGEGRTVKSNFMIKPQGGGGGNAPTGPEGGFGLEDLAVFVRLLFVMP